MAMAGGNYTNSNHTNSNHHLKKYYKCCDSQFFIHILAVVLLVLFAGLMSGLTLGLMSMSLVDLEVLAKSGTPKDRQHACTFSLSLSSRHASNSSCISPTEGVIFFILACKQAGKGGDLSIDETTIIAGALELTEKTARDAMTPLSATFAVDINAKLDKDLINLIMEKGHSRVPVYYEQPYNIIGLILVKNLLTINPADEQPVKNVTIRRIPRYYVGIVGTRTQNQTQKFVP